MLLAVDSRNTHLQAKDTPVTKGNSLVPVNVNLRGIGYERFTERAPFNEEALENNPETN